MKTASHKDFCKYQHIILSEYGLFFLNRMLMKRKWQEYMFFISYFGIVQVIENKEICFLFGTILFLIFAVLQLKGVRSYCRRVRVILYSKFICSFIIYLWFVLLLVYYKVKQMGLIVFSLSFLYSVLLVLKISEAYYLDWLNHLYSYTVSFGKEEDMDEYVKRLY